MEKLLVILSALCLWSCIDTSVPHKMDPQTFYKKEMTLIVDGVSREGVITMPFKEEGNDIRVIAKSDLDILVIESCQGIDSQDNAGNVTENVRHGPFNWFSKTLVKKRESRFTYRAKGIGKSSDCDLHFRGYAMDGRHSEAILGFQTDEYQLKGKMVCNQVERDFEGYEICQTKEGLIQEVHFNEDVKVVSQEGCSIGEGKRSFIFAQPLGHCLVLFRGKETGQFGKFKMYGFEAIPQGVK